MWENGTRGGSADVSAKNRVQRRTAAAWWGEQVPSHSRTRPQTSPSLTEAAGIRTLGCGRGLEKAALPAWVRLPQDTLRIWPRVAAFQATDQRSSVVCPGASEDRGQGCLGWGERGRHGGGVGAAPK